ncbi:hypothetical protein NDU88_001649 [Pleurodeles waltl]|uniref:Uncharacterized protein n=1 Tax=Pleurodeles waltl TaxID=8319 RepID=A0AAV7NGC5_PLEWA|nr:hypothetical protein NDU88_001649 [Pleurodeles waltl]
MPRRFREGSPLRHRVPRGRRREASDLQLGWGGMLSDPAGEPSNARHPLGPRRKEARLQRRASPLFRVAALCPVLCSPKPRRKQAPLSGAGGRGVGRSTPPPVVAAARAEGGVPLTASLREAHLSLRGQAATRGRGLCSCRRPQVRAPLSPRCIRGERFSFSLDVGPQLPPALRTCSNVAQGGFGSPLAPPPSSRGPSPRRARLLGGHLGSWPDHAPP